MKSPPSALSAPRRRTLAVLAACVVVLAACSGDKDDGEVIVGDPPDISGRYQVFITGTTGCDKEPEWTAGWAEGPMSIEGSADTLSFDFYDEVVLDGAVDGSYQYWFAGTATYDGAELSIYNSGSVQAAETGWTLDGALDIEVDDDEFDTNNCTITGTMEATQL